MNDTDNKKEPGQKKYYTSQDVVTFLGISRHKLIYWTDRAGLVEPYLRLANTNLYDFRNLLDLTLVKSLSSAGISTSKIAMLFKAKPENKGVKMWDAYKKNLEVDKTLRQLIYIVISGGLLFYFLAMQGKASEDFHILTHAPKNKTKTQGVEITLLITIPAYEIVEKVEEFTKGKL